MQCLGGLDWIYTPLGAALLGQKLHPEWGFLPYICKQLDTIIRPVHTELTVSPCTLAVRIGCNIFDLQMWRRAVGLQTWLWEDGVYTPKSHSLSSCYLSDSHFWGIPVGHISGHAHRNLPGLSVNEGVDKYPVSMLEINFVTWQCFASPSMLNVQELSHAL